MLPVDGSPDPGDPVGRRPPLRLLHRTVLSLLVAAVVLPAGLLLVGAWLAWDATWREARTELAQQADAGAEYAVRLLHNYSTAAGRVNDLLHGLTDAEIRAREAEFHDKLQALVADLPQLRTAFVVDRHGVPLVAAGHMPVPREPVAADREFFRALQAPNPPAIHVSHVQSSRLDGKPLLAVCRPRTGSANPEGPYGFDGLVNASVEPRTVTEGLARLIASPGDAIALFRDDRTMLARSSDRLGGLPSVPVESPFTAIVASGQREASYTVRSALTGEDQLVALRRLDGFPLYITAVRPSAMILARWRRSMVPQLAIGLPAMLALFGLALLVRRGQRALLAANDVLETRVTERTAALAEISGALDLTPCMITDLQGRISHWSAGCVRLYGHSREEALGQQVSELLATEFPPGGRAAILASLSRHGQWQGELRQRRRDGSPIITGTQWTLWFDPRTGDPNSIVSTRADLSALREAESALSRSEARARRAHDASGAVAFEVAADGTVVADPAMSGLLGLSTAEPLTRDTVFAQVHPCDRDAVREAYRQLSAGGTFAQEFRVVRPGGGYRWLLARGEAERDPAGGTVPRLIAGILFDESDRHDAEAALAETGERLRLAQAAAGFGIYDYDFQTGAVVWDARMRDFWSLPADVPVTSRLFMAGLHPDDRALRRAAVRQAMDPVGGGTYQVEYRVIGLTDGNERWIATTGQVRFARGRPVRLTGLAMDITARKRAEQRNDLLMREVDHRAKNALAVVQAALRLSRAETPAELVRIVEGRVSALARAQTILAKRRWEGAELQVLLEGELAPFLTGVLRDAPRALLSGPPVTVAAHAAQPLCMAVHELATNAMKYGALSFPGGVLHVSWRLDPTSRMLTMTWRETGGPAVAAAPVRRGFGTRVIEQTVQGQLGGKVSSRWLAGGLLCDIQVPLSRTEQLKPAQLDGEQAPNAAAA